MTSSQSDKFDPLVENLERFVEITRQLGLIASDVQPQGQATLNQKLHMLVGGLQELDKNKEQVQDVQVPLELIYEYVDQGKNPQLYTKDCMERAVAKNELVKGKIETFRRFKKALITELGKMFPEEIDRYKSVGMLAPVKKFLRFARPTWLVVPWLMVQLIGLHSQNYFQSWYKFGVPLLVKMKT